MNHLEINNGSVFSSRPDESSTPESNKRNIRPIKIVGLSITWSILFVIFVFACFTYTSLSLGDWYWAWIGTFSTLWGVGSFILLAYLFKTYKQTLIRKLLSAITLWMAIFISSTCLYVEQMQFWLSIDLMSSWVLLGFFLMIVGTCNTVGVVHLFGLKSIKETISRYWKVSTFLLLIIMMVFGIGMISTVLTVNVNDLVPSQDPLLLNFLNEEGLFQDINEDEPSIQSIMFGLELVEEHNKKITTEVSILEDKEEEKEVEEKIELDQEAILAFLTDLVREGFRDNLGEVIVIRELGITDQILLPNFEKWVDQAYDKYNKINYSKINSAF